MKGAGKLGFADVSASISPKMAVTLDQVKSAANLSMARIDRILDGGVPLYSMGYQHLHPELGTVSALELALRGITPRTFKTEYYSGGENSAINNRLGRTRKLTPEGRMTVNLSVGAGKTPHHDIVNIHNRLKYLSGVGETPSQVFMSPTPWNAWGGPGMHGVLTTSKQLRGEGPLFDMGRMGVSLHPKNVGGNDWMLPSIPSNKSLKVYIPHKNSAPGSLGRAIDKRLKDLGYIPMNRRFKALMRNRLKRQFPGQALAEESSGLTRAPGLDRIPDGHADFKRLLVDDGRRGVPGDRYFYDGRKLKGDDFLRQEGLDPDEVAPRHIETTKPKMDAIDLPDKTVARSLSDRISVPRNWLSRLKTVLGDDIIEALANASRKVRA